MPRLWIALLGLPLLAQAADDKDQIATDRPDFVESSNVVGTGRFQLETSLRWSATRPMACASAPIPRRPCCASASATRWKRASRPMAACGW
jgi:hypothetical protein